MYIHNDDKQNYPFCRLNLSVEKFETTNQDFLNKHPKFLYSEPGILRDKTMEKKQCKQTMMINKITPSVD